MLLVLQAIVHPGGCSGSLAATGAKCLAFGQFVAVSVNDGSPPNKVSSVKGSVVTLAAAPHRNHNIRSGVSGILCRPKVYGKGGTMLAVEAASNWGDVERVLQQKHLVQSDGCLHLQAVATELL